jgi:hypothetical protein
VDARDLELRNLIYAKVVQFGRVPIATEIAAATGRDPAEVVAGWQRLHDQHALVLNPAPAEIRMANPFSTVPTAHRVHAARRWWYANCAWDAFGICAALHIAVRDQRPDNESLLFHCLVSAAHLAVASRDEGVRATICTTAG